ncbi:unnamed protein product [Larinioides sclopetarius]
MKAITLPEILGKVEDLELKKIDEDGIFESHQSQIEDITLKEVTHDTRLINDDEHFDIFGEENIPMDFEENIPLASLLDDGEDKDHPIPKDAEAMSDTECCNGGEAGNGSFDSLPDKKRLRHMSDSQELIPLWLADKKPKDDNKLNLEPLSNDFFINQRIRKQKRKLIVDEVKSMSREKVEKQVQDFSDLVVPLDLAPPSKRLMILKEIGSAEQLLHQPGMKITSTEIQNLFKGNLKMHKTEEVVEDSTSSEETDISISIEVARRKLFGDEYAPENGFDEHFLPCELTDQHELFNEDALPENAMNSDSSTNDVGYFNEQKNAMEEIQLSVEFQQDSGCSSNGVSKLCQKKIIKLLRKLKLLFTERHEIKFSNLVQTDRKRKVAQKFHSMLMIKKFNIVEVQQAESYGEIVMTKGANFVVACEDIY